MAQDRRNQDYRWRSEDDGSDDRWRRDQEQRRDEPQGYRGREQGGRQDYGRGREGGWREEYGRGGGGYRPERFGGGTGEYTSDHGRNQMGGRGYGEYSDWGRDWGRGAGHEDRSRGGGSGAGGGGSTGESGFGRPGGYERDYGYGREGSSGRGSGQDYGYGRQGQQWGRDDWSRGRGGERGFWDRASDEVSSWFGDRDAEQRREMDEHRGRGPKNYTRSDDRIREDVSDRLSDDPTVDASDVEVKVSKCEVTLDGTVTSRDQRRRAEDCAERVSGVKHVQNNLRVKERGQTGMASGPHSGSTGGTSTTGSGSTGSGNTGRW